MYTAMIKRYESLEVSTKYFETYDEAMSVTNDPEVEYVIIFDKNDEVIL